MAQKYDLNDNVRTSLYEYVSEKNFLDKKKMTIHWLASDLIGGDVSSPNRADSYVDSILTAIQECKTSANVMISTKIESHRIDTTSPSFYCLGIFDF